VPLVGAALAAVHGVDAADVCVATRDAATAAFAFGGAGS
jgi:hypothetical protein